MLKTQAGSMKQDNRTLLLRPDVNPIFFIEELFNLNLPLEDGKSRLYFFACQLRKTVIQNCGNQESFFTKEIHKILINNYKQKFYTGHSARHNNSD
jgi:hypothetical protein